MYACIQRKSMEFYIHVCRYNVCVYPKRVKLGTLGTLGTVRIPYVRYGTLGTLGTVRYGSKVVRYVRYGTDTIRI